MWGAEWSGVDVGAAIGSPAALPGLALWLDASQLVGADGSAIGTWPDLSGHGYNAVQATGANKPTLKLAIQNGLSVARFTGAPQSFLTFSGAALNLFRHIPGCTVATVMRSLDGGSGAFGWLWASNGADPTIYRVALGNDTGTFEFYTSATDDNASQLSAIQHVWTSNLAPALTWGFMAGVGVLDLANPFVTAEASAARGAASVTANGDPTAALFENTPSLFMSVGSDGRGIGGQPVNGDYGELIVYQRALGARERRLLLEYLGRKWAVL
jgi:hypothetical protein